MKIINATSFFISIFLFNAIAFALPASTSVKVTPLLKTQNSWNGKPIVYPQGQAEISAMLVEIAPGGETGWHLHPVPSFGMVLQGELEVRLKSGETKRVKANEALAEVVDVLHNGRNVGKDPVKLIVFYAGTVGQKLSTDRLLLQGTLEKKTNVSYRSPYFLMTENKESFEIRPSETVTREQLEPWLGKKVELEARYVFIPSAKADPGSEAESRFVNGIIPNIEYREALSIRALNH